jgi:hypothetical protein
MKHECAVPVRLVKKEGSHLRWKTRYNFIEKISGWKVLPGTLLKLVKLKQPNDSCECLHGWHLTTHAFAQGSNPCKNKTNKVKANDSVYDR